MKKEKEIISPEEIAKKFFSEITDGYILDADGKSVPTGGMMCWGVDAVTKLIEKEIITNSIYTTQNKTQILSALKKLYIDEVRPINAALKPISGSNSANVVFTQWVSASVDIKAFITENIKRLEAHTVRTPPPTKGKTNLQSLTLKHGSLHYVLKQIIKDGFVMCDDVKTFLKIFSGDKINGSQRVHFKSVTNCNTFLRFLYKKYSEIKKERTNVDWVSAANCFIFGNNYEVIPHEKLSNSKFKKGTSKKPNDKINFAVSLLDNTPASKK